MDRPPPAYSADPDDPFQSVDPQDPNLTFTAPPNPANMRRPTEPEDSPVPCRLMWYMLTGAEAVGITSSWHITRTLTHGISNQVYVSYDSWDEALAVYTIVYNAHVVKILRKCTTRHSRCCVLRAHPTPQTTPGGIQNTYMITSSAPSMSQRPSGTPGGSHSNPCFVASSPGMPLPSGHPKHPFYIGSSPTPVSPTPRSHTATPLPTQGSATCLCIIEKALLEGSPRTPTPVHDTQACNSVRSHINALENALRELLGRWGSVPSPQTIMQDNSNINSHLSALESAMDNILTKEAEHESNLAHQCEGMILDGRDSTPQHNYEILDRSDSTPSHSVHPFLDGRDLTPPHSAVPAIPVMGSSTGAGVFAGEASNSVAGSSTGPGTLASASCHDTIASNRHISLALGWDDDDKYPFIGYTPKENAKLGDLLDAIQQNYLANKQDN